MHSLVNRTLAGISLAWLKLTLAVALGVALFSPVASASLTPGQYGTSNIYGSVTLTRVGSNNVLTIGGVSMNVSDNGAGLGNVLYAYQYQNVTAGDTVFLGTHAYPIAYSAYTDSSYMVKWNGSQYVQHTTFDCDGNVWPTENLGTSVMLQLGYAVLSFSTTMPSGHRWDYTEVSAMPTDFTITPLTFTYNGGSQGPTITPTTGGASFTVTAGQQSATAAGSYSVTATANGSYTGTRTSGWTINQASQTVGWSAAPGSVTAGSSLTFSANGAATGSYTWSVSPGGPTGISGNGASQTITFPSAGGPYTVSVYANGNGNYSQSATINTSVTVASANVAPVASITVNGTVAGNGALVGSASIYFGQPITFSGTLTDVDGNLSRHAVIVQDPVAGWLKKAGIDYSWWTAYSDSSSFTAFSQANGLAVASGSSDTITGTFLPSRLGTFQVTTNGHDGALWSAGANVSLNVVKATPTLSALSGQTISYGSPVTAGMLNVTAANPYTVAVTAPSGAVTYNATGYGAISAGTVLPFGSYSVTATYPGDGNYNTITSSPVTFTITNSSPTVTMSINSQPNNATFASNTGASLSIVLTAADANADLRAINLWVNDPASGAWHNIRSDNSINGAYIENNTTDNAVSSGGSNVASLSGTRTYTIPLSGGFGTYQFVARSIDSNGYNSTSASTNVTVANRTPTTTLTASTNNAVYGQVVTLTNTSSDPDGGLTLNSTDYSSDNSTWVGGATNWATTTYWTGSAASNVITASWTATSPGTYYFRARAQDSGGALSSFSTQNVVVSKASQSTPTLTGTQTITVLGTAALTPAGGNSTGAWVYNVTGTAGGSVNASTGVYTPANPGSASITVQRATDTNYLISNSSAAVTVTVTQVSQAAPTWTTASQSIVYGAGYTAPTPSNTGQGGLTWTRTGGTAVGGAVNSSTGAISYSGIGTITMTAVYAGNANYAASPASSVYTATVTVRSLPVTGLSAQNKVYDTTMTATLSGSPTISLVNSDTTANVILGGTPVATFASASVGSNINVNVTGYSLSGAQSGNYTLIQPAGLTANITKATAATPSLTPSANPSTFPAPVTWVYANTTTNQFAWTINGTQIANFNGAGWSAYSGSFANGTWVISSGYLVVTPTSTTGYSVMFSDLGNANYTAADSATITQTVGKATPTMSTLSAQSFSYGTAVTSGMLNVTASGSGVAPTGTITYSASGYGAISAGTVLPVNPYTVTATYPGDGNYNSATTTATWTVSNSPPALSLTVNETTSISATTVVAANISFGQSIAISSTATDIDGNLTHHGIIAKNVVSGFLKFPGADYLWFSSALVDSASWTACSQPAGNTVSSGSSNAVTGTFLPPSVGTYRVRATAMDATNILSANDPRIDVTVQSATPTLSAFSNQTFTAGAAITPEMLNVSAFNPYSGAVAGPSGVITYSDSVYGAISAGTVLPAGSYSVTASYPGDTNYNATTTTATFTVNAISQAAPTWSTAAQSVTYGAAYAIPVPTNSGQGALTWTRTGGTAAGASVNSSSGAISYAGVGTITLTANYAAIINYSVSPDSATYTVTINQRSLPVTGLSAQNKAYDGTATASLSGSSTIAAGLVNGDTTANVVLNGASASANFPSAAVGTNLAVTVTGYSLSGTQAGNYLIIQPSGLTANITKATSVTPTIASSANPSTFPAPVTFTPSGGSTGLYGWTINGTQVATYNGSSWTTASGAYTGGTWTISGLNLVATPTSATGYTVVLTDLGNSNYSSADSATLTQTVNKGTQAALTVSANPTTVAYHGTSILSTTGGTTGGLVTYTCNSNGSISGSTFTANNGGGTVVVTATMAGDANYNARTDTVTITLIKADGPVPTVTASANPSTFPSMVSYTPGNRTTGDYAWTINGTTISNYSAGMGFFLPQTGSYAGGTWKLSGLVLQVTPTSATNYTVAFTNKSTSVYNAASSDTLTQTVNKASQAALTVSADPTTVVYNGTSLLSATGGTGAGAVSYASAAGGSVSGLTFTATSGTGTVVVTATKVGDSNYNDQTGTVTITLAKATPTLSALSGQSFRYGAMVTDGMLDVVASGAGVAPTGAITYNASGYGAISAGTILPDATYTVTASYPGDANYASATTTATWTVTNTAPETSITVNGSYSIGGPTIVNGTPIYFGQTLNFSAGITDVDGNVARHGVVVLDRGWMRAPGLDYGWWWGGCPDSTAFTSISQTDGNAVSNTSSDTITGTFLPYRATSYQFVSQGYDSRLVWAFNANLRIAVLKATPDLSALSNQTFAYGTPITAGMLNVSASNPYSGAVDAPTGAITYSADGYGAIVAGTILPGGAYSVTASYPGDDNYNTNATTATFTVNKGTQTAPTLTGATTISYGGSATLTPSGGQGSGAYVYNVSGSAGGSMSGNVYTPTSSGSASITVTRDADANYEASSPSTAVAITVNAKALTITGLAFVSKAYDTTTTASASGTPALEGIVGADVITVAGTPTYTFASANVANAIPVSTTGFTLAGANAGSYTLSQPSGSADITAGVQAPLSITPISSIFVHDPCTATATGGSGTGALVWSLGLGSTAQGDIDASTGVVTTTTSGKLVLQVRRAADANYAESASSPDYPLAIGSRDQSVSSRNDTVTVDDPFTPFYSGGNGTGEWQMKVANGAWTTLGPVDTSVVGPLQFFVRKAGDTVYNESPAAGPYTLTIDLRVQDPLSSAGATVLLNAVFTPPITGAPDLSIVEMKVSSNDWQPLAKINTSVDGPVTFFVRKAAYGKFAQSPVAGPYTLVVEPLNKTQRITVRQNNDAVWAAAAGSQIYRKATSAGTVESVTIMQYRVQATKVVNGNLTLTEGFSTNPEAVTGPDDYDHLLFGYVPEAWHP